MKTKGIDRTVEAVRVALTRLTRDEKLVRTVDGRFAVANGGVKVEASDPLSRDTSLESQD